MDDFWVSEQDSCWERKYRSTSFSKRSRKRVVTSSEATGVSIGWAARGETNRAGKSNTEDKEGVSIKLLGVRFRFLEFELIVEQYCQAESELQFLEWFLVFLVEMFGLLLLVMDDG